MQCKDVRESLTVLEGLADANEKTANQERGCRDVVSSPLVRQRHSSSTRGSMRSSTRSSLASMESNHDPATRHDSNNSATWVDSSLEGGGGRDGVRNLIWDGGIDTASVIPTVRIVT